MYAIQFETPFGEAQYIVKITNSYINGSRQFESAKKFESVQEALDYCKKTDINPNFKIIKII